MGIIEDLQSISQPTQREQYRIYASEEYPDPEMIFERDGISFCPRGDIIAFSGKAKSRKTFCISILIASLFGCEDFDIKSHVANPKVLVFDTEQSKGDVSRVLRRINKLLKWEVNTDREDLVFYGLREIMLKDRYQFIVDKVMEKAPTAIVIDGIADLIFNFNDIDQSTDIISKLLALCSETNIALLTILHENKSEDNINMKGHLGTLLLQKAASVFHTSISDDGTTTVKNTESRSKTLHDWYFKIDDDGMPIISGAPITPKEQKEIEELKEMMLKAFGNSESLMRSEIVERLNSNGISTPTAYRKIEKAVEKKVLDLDSNLYRINSP